MVASSDEHLWIVTQLDGSSGQIRLHHHAAAMGGPYVTIGPPLGQMPQAIAAWGDRVWIVYPPHDDHGNLAREVLTTQVRPTATGGYSFTPHDRLGVVAELPGEAELVGLVSGADGPYALLVPEAVGGHPGMRAATDKPSLQKPTLLWLHNNQWLTVELPPDSDLQQPLHLGVGGSMGRSIWLIAPISEGSSQSVISIRPPGAGWSRSEVAVDVAEIAGVARVGGQILLTLQPPSGNAQLAYLRPTALLPLMELPVSDDGSIAGLRHEILLLRSLPRQGELSMQRIDEITGEISPPVTMTRQPMNTAGIIHIPILITVGVMVILLAFVSRPNPQLTRATLPSELAPTAPVTRLLALAMDLAPGAILAMNLFHCHLSDLVRSTVWPQSAEQSLPWIATVAIAVVHGTIGEIGWGRSFGKAVMGISVVRLDGGRAQPASILLRNLLKAAILLVPLLAITTLLNALHQSLADIVARTVVVRPRTGDEPPAIDDDR